MPVLDTTSRKPFVPVGFIVELESVRGIAALVVFMSHILLYTNPAMTYRQSTTPGFFIPSLVKFSNGYAAGAVIIFFVMSGYVMNNMWKREYFFYAYPKFIARRAIRLLPVMYLSIPVTYGAYLFADYLQTSFAGPVNVDWYRLWQNLLMYKIDINGVLWSLKIEIYSCLVLPFYLFIRDRSKLLGLLLIIFMTTTPFLLLPNDQNLFLFNFYLFMIGAEINYFNLNASGRVDRNRIITAVSIMALGSVGFLEYTSGLETAGANLFLFYQHSMHILQGVAAFFIVAIMTGTMGAKPGARLLRSDFFRFIGLISYSLYLFHPTVLVLFPSFFAHEYGRTLNNERWTTCAPWVIIIVFVSIVSAYLIHRKVELPSIALSRRFGKFDRGRDAHF